MKTSVSTMSTPFIKWATLSDMRGSQFNKTFRDLEDYQSRFFAVQDKVKSEPYKWPLRPLYEWSRRVEYPFVISVLPKENGLRILDAGSGVTFFPPYISQMLRINVECMDKEPSYAERMKQVCDLLGISPSIPYHIGDLTRKLPFDDGAFNVGLCISVLEHLPYENRLSAMHELWRIVSPGGQLIMTFDVSLTGEAEGLLLDEVGEFVSKLENIVGRQFPPLPKFLPSNLLTTECPGYGLAPLQVGVDGPLVRSGLNSWMFRLFRRRLPVFKSLACLLCSIPKPKGNRE